MPLSTPHTCGGNVGTARLNHLCTTWRLVISFTPRPFYPVGRYPRQYWTGPHKRSADVWRMKYILPMAENHFVRLDQSLYGLRLPSPTLSSSGEVKNAWRFTSTLPSAFMAYTWTTLPSPFCQMDTAQFTCWLSQHWGVAQHWCSMRWNSLVHTFVTSPAGKIIWVTKPDRNICANRNRHQYFKTLQTWFIVSYMRG
jgi:hypothetical protein